MLLVYISVAGQNKQCFSLYLRFKLKGALLPEARPNLPYLQERAIYNVKYNYSLVLRSSHRWKTQQQCKYAKRQSLHSLILSEAAVTEHNPYKYNQQPSPQY